MRTTTARNTTKRILIALAITMLLASIAMPASAVQVFGNDGTYIGELIQKGYDFDLGTWSVKVWIPDLGKFANISSSNGNILNMAPHGWCISAPDSLGYWEGFYFTSGSEWFDSMDAFGWGNERGYKADYCPECGKLFPVIVPLQYR